MTNTGAVHGWIILDKPVGLGSTQAVAAVKRMLRGAGLWGKTKRDRPKVGHGGTLDPLATGVLPIAIGEATKLTGRLLDASKIYEFTIKFGEATDTLDTEGEVVQTSDHRPTLADIEAALPAFTGVIDQIPPAYSAIHVDGKRAYDRARAGETVEIPKRKVTVGKLSPSQQNVPDDPEQYCNEITLTAHVSKGTYIRSLARDIAVACGTVGHVTMLRRVKAGPFTLEKAISLDKVNEIANGAGLEAVLLPLEAGLADIPALSLTPDQADKVRHGGVLDRMAVTEGIHLAKQGETPVALMEVEAGNARVLRGFNF